MPELPEVETIRRYLHSILIGKYIADITVLNPKSFRGVIADIIGKKVIDTGRQGKVMNLKLDDNTFISVHLKMSGQLILDLKERTPATRVIITFTDGTRLFFNDARKFGWVVHSKQPEGTKAPDVTRPEFTLPYFTSVVEPSKKPIKSLLLDQDKIAGIGNIYANDALFTAKILPYRLGNTLTSAEIGALYTSVKATIQEGLDSNGTSATDVYVMPNGSKGTYQNHFKVYSREGEPCLVCGTPILKEKLNGRGSYYCPVCQQ